jgi:Zn finger protein HypA/HybF involved in hydrogenase expression
MSIPEKTIECKCPNCGYEYTIVLLEVYEIEKCPNCGCQYKLKGG